MRNSKPILLIEDDKVDVMTVKRAFKELDIQNPVAEAGNGEEGLDYLKNKDNPCLILLDINMPRMNGIEFLEEVKKDEYLRLIPVVVLTTSKDPKDKAETFGRGISGYLVKPVDYQRFVEMIKTLDEYWTMSESVD